MDLVDTIRTEIEKKGIKHRWLAEKIGVHPTTLSRFLTRKRGIGSEIKMSLLRELNLDDLFPVSPEKKRAS